MNTMRFYAKGTAKVGDLTSTIATGMPREYVGRVWDAAKRAHPASEAPYECTLGTPAGNRCMKACQQGDLWPADVETAAVIGVAFVEVIFLEGAWVPAPAVEESKGPLPEGLVDNAVGSDTASLVVAPGVTTQLDAPAAPEADTNEAVTDKPKAGHRRH